MFGVSLSFVFTPLFLVQELGVTDAREVALWTALSGGALGLSRAVMSPVWGMLADRFGRKPMLVRASILSGAALTLMFAAQQPIHVVLIYFVFGGTGGILAVSTAIVAREVPRRDVGFAIGALQSAAAFAQSIGPFIGSLIAVGAGLRAMYAVGGIAYICSALPVVLFVKEAHAGGPSIGDTHRLVGWSARAALIPALGGLLLANLLLWTTTSATQPLFALQIVQTEPATAVWLTGIAFGVASLLTAAASVTQSTVVNVVGYRTVSVAAAALCAAGILAAALAPSAILLVAAIGLVGLTRGVLTPSISAMIGLEAPIQLQATALGLAGMVQALGMAVSPFFGSGIAAAASISVGLFASTSLAIALAGVLVLWVREPSTEEVRA